MRRPSPVVLIALLLGAVYRTTDEPVVRVGVLLIAGCVALALLGWFVARRDMRLIGLTLIACSVVVAIGGTLLTAMQHPVLRQMYAPDALSGAPEVADYRGFYGVQTDTPTGSRYTWTQERATLVLNTLPHRPITLTVEMRSAAVAGGPDTPVQVVVNNQPVGIFRPDPQNTAFQSLSLRFIPNNWGGDQTEIKLLATPFTAKGDARTLGTMVKSITVDKSEAWGGYTRRAWLLWALPLLAIMAGALEWLARRRNARFAALGAIGSCLAGAGGAAVLLLTIWRIGPINPVQFRNGMLGTALLTLVFILTALALALMRPAPRAFLGRFSVTSPVQWVRVRLHIRRRLTPADAPAAIRTWHGVRDDLALLLVMALAVRLIWALLVPPWLAPDEPDHYIYASHIVEQGLPDAAPSPYDAYPHEYGTSANLVHIPDLSSGLSARPRAARYLPVDYDYTAARDYGETGAARRTNTGSRAFPYPPLYYLLAAIPYKIAYAAPVIVRLFAVRLASVIFGALSCLCGYLFAYELRGTRRWGWALGWCMALMPMFVFSNATVNNDAALFCFCTALMWLLARFWMRKDAPLALVAALGMTGGLVVITKPTGDGLVAVAGGVVVLRAIALWWSARRARRGQLANAVSGADKASGRVSRLLRPLRPLHSLLAPVIYTLAVLLTTTPWTLYHRIYSGEWGVFSGVAAALVGRFSHSAASGTEPAPRASYSLASYLRFETHRGGDYFHWLLVKTFWGYFGWLDEPMAYRVYIPITIFCIIGLIGCVGQAVFQPPRRAALALAFTLVLMQLLWVFLGADYYEGWRQSGQDLGLQGRYFLPILAPALFLWLSGWEYLVRDRPLALRLAPFAMLAVQIAALGTILFTYYGVAFG